MKRKLLSILLTVCMVLTMLPAAAFPALAWADDPAPEEEGTYTYGHVYVEGREEVLGPGDTLTLQRGERFVHLGTVSTGMDAPADGGYWIGTWDPFSLRENGFVVYDYRSDGPESAGELFEEGDYSTPYGPILDTSFVHTGSYTMHWGYMSSVDVERNGFSGATEVGGFDITIQVVMPEFGFYSTPNGGEENFLPVWEYDYYAAGNETFGTPSVYFVSTGDAVIDEMYLESEEQAYCEPVSGHAWRITVPDLFNASWLSWRFDASYPNGEGDPVTDQWVELSVRDVRCRLAFRDAWEWEGRYFDDAIEYFRAIGEMGEEEFFGEPSESPMRSFGPAEPNSGTLLCLYLIHTDGTMEAPDLDDLNFPENMEVEDLGGGFVRLRFTGFEEETDFTVGYENDVGPEQAHVMPLLFHVELPEFGFYSAPEVSFANYLAEWNWDGRSPVYLMSRDPEVGLTRVSLTQDWSGHAEATLVEPEEGPAYGEIYVYDLVEEDIYIYFQQAGYNYPQGREIHINDCTPYLGFLWADVDWREDGPQGRLRDENARPERDLSLACGESRYVQLVAVESDGSYVPVNGRDVNVTFYDEDPQVVHSENDRPPVDLCTIDQDGLFVEIYAIDWGQAELFYVDYPEETGDEEEPLWVYKMRVSVELPDVGFYSDEDACEETFLPFWNPGETGNTVYVFPRDEGTVFTGIRNDSDNEVNITPLTVEFTGEEEEGQAREQIIGYAVELENQWDHRLRLELEGYWDLDDPGSRFEHHWAEIEIFTAYQGMALYRMEREWDEDTQSEHFFMRDEMPDRWLVASPGDEIDVLFEYFPSWEEDAPDADLGGTVRIGDLRWDPEFLEVEEVDEELGVVHLRFLQLGDTEVTFVPASPASGEEEPASEPVASLPVRVVLPDVGFYSAPVATEENALSSWVLDGTNDTIYLVAAGSARLSDVWAWQENPNVLDIVPVGEGQNGYYTAFAITLLYMDNDWLDLRISGCWDVENAEDTVFEEHGRGLRIVDRRPGLFVRWMEGCGWDQQNDREAFEPSDREVENRIFGSPGDDFVVQIFLDDRQGNNDSETLLGVADLTWDEDVMDISAVEGYDDLLRIRLLDFTDAPAAVICGDYAIRVWVDLPDVGFYSFSEASRENYISQWALDGSNDTVYLVCSGNTRLTEVWANEFNPNVVDIVPVYENEDYYTAFAVTLLELNDDWLDLRFSGCWDAVNDPNNMFIDHGRGLNIVDRRPGLFFRWMRGEWDEELGRDVFVPEDREPERRIAAAPGDEWTVQIYFDDMLGNPDSQTVLTATDLEGSGPFWLEDGEDGVIILHFTNTFDSGSLFYVSDGNEYCLPVNTELPAFGFYSDEDACEETFLFDLTLRGDGEVIYFIARNGATLERVWGDFGTDIDVELVSSECAEITVNNVQGEYLDVFYDGMWNEEDANSAFTNERRSLRVNDLRPGMFAYWGRIEPDPKTGEPIFMPAYDQGGAWRSLAIFPGYTFLIQVRYRNENGMETILTADDLTTRGNISVEAVNLDNNFVIIEATGFGQGSLIYQNEVLPISVELPGVGYYSTTTASEQTYLGSKWEYTGETDTVYLVAQEGLRLTAVNENEQHDPVEITLDPQGAYAAVRLLGEPREGFILHFDAVEEETGEYYERFFNVLTMEIVDVRPQIITQPQDFYGAMGDVATFHVDAEAYGENNGLTYQWQVYNNGWANSTASGSKTATLKAGAMTEARLGYRYRCIITDRLGRSVITEEVRMRLAPRMDICYVTEGAAFTGEPYEPGTLDQLIYAAAKGWANANDRDMRTSSLFAAEGYEFTEEDRIEHLEWVLDGGYNVVIVAGFSFINALEEIVPDHEDVIFLALDVSADDFSEDFEIPDNLLCITYREEVAGFLAGYAAVMMGYDGLGFLGGMEIPAVMRYGYGFIQGAEAAAATSGRSGVTVRFGYANQFWGDEALTAAMDTWYANGTQVVFACGGGAYTSVAGAAASAGGKVIGVDLDQAALIDGAFGQGLTLTSAAKAMDVTVVNVLDAILNGAFTGGCEQRLGIVSADPENNHVQLPLDTTQWNAAFTQADYRALVASLLAGTVTVSDDIARTAASYANTVTVEDLGTELTVIPVTPLEIVTQPTDFIGAIGDTATFTVVAEGDGLTYQWQVNSGSGWKNSTASGNKTAKLKAGTITEARLQCLYRCIITDAQGNTVTTNEVRMVLPQPALIIVTQPVDFEGEMGATAYFTVVAEGDGLKYQWQVNSGSGWKNSTASGNKTAKLKAGAITEARLQCLYRCIITDAQGNTVTTNEVRMVLPQPALIIVTQPVDFEGEMGATAYFTVVAEGDGLTYQWQVNSGSGWKNSTASGNKTAKLKAGAITEARLQYLYRCIITDAQGNTVTTNEVRMALPQPALIIVTQPVDFEGEMGEIAIFQVTAEGDGLTYQWQVNDGSGWKNSGSSGNKTAKLKAGAITEARLGYLYRCIITDAHGNTITTDEVRMVLASTITITAQPADFTGTMGEIAIFQVTAEGDGLTYQWQVNDGSGWKNSGSSGNKTAKLKAGAITEARLGYLYRCIITDSHGNSVTTDEVRMVLRPTLTIVTQPVDFVGAMGEIAVFQVAAEGDGLKYQWQVNDGSGWKNSGSSGNKTAKLKAGAITEARLGYRYRCIITDEHGNTVTTNEVRMILG